MHSPRLWTMHTGFRQQDSIREHGLLVLGGVLALGSLAADSRAAIDLRLVADQPAICAGQTIGVRLIAASDTPSVTQMSAAMQVIIQWDPRVIDLVDADPTGATPLLAAGFFSDPFGLNESDPPHDGNGIFFVFAPLSSAIPATPAGTVITTFHFVAVGCSSATDISILASAGSPLGTTIVFDGKTPGLAVTGLLTGTAIGATISPADLNCNGIVNGIDLALLLGQWTGAGLYAPCPPLKPADLNGDCRIDGFDLAMLLAAWGACP